MVNFDTYYQKLLNIQLNELKKDQLNYFVSDFLSLPICQLNFFPIIFTKWEDYEVCSCTKGMLSLIKDLNQEEIKSCLEDICPAFSWFYYRRYAYENSTVKLETKAVQLDLELYLSIAKDKNPDHITEDLMSILTQRSLQVVIEDNKIVSQAQISDIYAQGGNIAVSTAQDYRLKGYAKETVKAAINVAFDHNCLPVYMVKEENIASIKVAESLGFKLKAKELCVYQRK